jgi:Protein of unknown function (DUF3575)
MKSLGRGLLLLSIFATPAAAAPPPSSAESTSEMAWPLTSTGAVDVALREPAPPRRYLALELNPLAGLALHRWGANIIVAPFEHHAIVVNPFHAYARTYPINLYDDNGNPLRLPVQRFNGWGGELGYRYYTGRGGLRGLFLGPSLFADWMTVQAQDGSQTSYIYYGLAADVGYQVLISDRVSLSFGGGLQYGRADKDIPRQGFMAKYYANPIVLPRWLVSIGWAL